MALLPFQRKSYSGFLRSEKIHRPPVGVHGTLVQEDAVNFLGIRNWKAAARNREEWRRIVGEAMARKRAEVP